MHASTIISGVTMLLASGAAAAPFVTRQVAAAPCVPGEEVSPEQQAANFADFVQTYFVKKDVSTSFTNYVLENYINHNPALPSGRQTAILGMGPVLPRLQVTIRDSGFSDGTGWVHSKIVGLSKASYSAVADFYRFEGGCIAEHWDSIQDAPPADRANPLELI